ncbi:hypothetical protein GYMLUDRAFT_83894 [Collybiopsis luxurians FD-317 M1]|uniref:Carotenoid oxygenase n=1 Tax=Collybiopsis luxurians FD-317 M1 TaxID=944289 RepID=A0A0D0D2F9_9AGAR|nr:hypothetical protein GYMLUDRAFT_83894 [Collybiopsis luxurians FD-317 M1]
MSSSIQSSVVGFDNALEQRVPISLAIQGTIPSWLAGVLYRTGPGTYHIPSSANPSQSVDIQHWFDGLGMNHRFEIHPESQRVSYSSRKSSEDFERQISEQGKLPRISFGQQPDICQSIFRKFFTTFQQMASSTDSLSPSGVNVQVTLSADMPGWDNIIEGLPSEVKLHDHSGPRYLVAKTDSDALQLLDPISLEPLASASYKALDSRLDGQLSAAHSCWDKEANEFYNFSCKLGGRFPTYKIFRIKGDASVDIIAQIEDAPPSYLHSFAMTSKYVVLAIWQAHIAGYGLSILYNQNIAQAIEKWKPNVDSLFYVIDKKNGGVIAKYKTPAFFCFHQINAYDDPTSDDIIIDMSVYEDHSVIHSLYLDKLRTPFAKNSEGLIGRPRRFRLPAVTSSTADSIAQAEVMFTLPPSESIELPTINPAFSHRPYRFAYGINESYTPGQEHSFADRIVKLDMQNAEERHRFWGVPGYTPSEPVFVPRPGSKAEDDGVILSVVLDGNRGKSMLVILDAQSMKECARAEMETVFPIGFHGIWSQKRSPNTL